MTEDELGAKFAYLVGSAQGQPKAKEIHRLAPESVDDDYLHTRQRSLGLPVWESPGSLAASPQLSAFAKGPREACLGVAA